MKNMGRTLVARTVRQVRTEQKTPDPESQLSQIIIGFPKVKAMETRVWGLEKRHTRML
jgi:hypothetical protein